MYNWFEQYLAEGWKEYWSRGWCRIEAMCAAVKPVDEGRAELFRGAVKVQLLAGHRPHVLSGTKELEETRPPLFLPRLLVVMVGDDGVVELRARPPAPAIVDEPTFDVAAGWWCTRLA